MILDLIVLGICVALVAGGWHRGLRNSWPAPLAFIIATVGTKALYPQFCGWLVSNSDADYRFGVFVGYLILWVTFEAIAGNLLLQAVSKWRPPAGYRPPLIGQAFGGAIGLVKAVCVVIFATLACSHSSFSGVGAGDTPIAHWVAATSDSSWVLNQFPSICSHVPKSLMQASINVGNVAIHRSAHSDDTATAHTSEVREMFKQYSHLRHDTDGMMNTELR